MKSILNQLKKKGYKLVNKSTDNGREVWLLIGKELELIRLDYDVSPDTEVLLDVLGVSTKDFDKMCEGKDEEDVLVGLVNKHKE